MAFVRAASSGCSPTPSIASASSAWRTCRQGGALLVCNHVSYIDWLLVLAAQRRFIRFVIYAPYANLWGFRHLLRWAQVIPIDGSAGPRAIVQALRAASDALAAGDVVCIFAEGTLSRAPASCCRSTAASSRSSSATPAPIVPVCLDQVWGSIFSYHGRQVFWKMPRDLPYPVSVAFGPPLPATEPAAEVRQAIQKLSADCAVRRSGKLRAGPPPVRAHGRPAPVPAVLRRFDTLRPTD